MKIKYFPQTDCRGVKQEPFLIFLIAVAFLFCASVSASDYEDSLLIERLQKLSRSEKMIVVDSLMRYDPDRHFRLSKSSKFRESESPWICAKIWPGRFVNAEMGSKTLVIDSMFADFSINYDLIGDILLTEKYRDQFPSAEDFMSYRTKLALKTGRDHRSHSARKILLEYYHGGKRTRTFERPSRQQFITEGGQSIELISDTTGIEWELAYSWYYPGCRNNLWLATLNPDSESWSDPMFTGLCIQIPHDAISLLKFIGNQPYLIDERDQMFQLASPKYLTRDLDNDGFFDMEETAFGTDPTNYDTDGDGLADGIDINPLAAGVKNPGDEDLATRAVIRLFAKENNSVNIYLLFGIFNRQMEYYTESPNAMFLASKKPWPEWGFNNKSGAIPLFVSRHQENDSLIIVLAESKGEKYLYRLEKHSGDWIITLGGPKHPTRNTIVGFKGNILGP